MMSNRTTNIRLGAVKEQQPKPAHPRASCSDVEIQNNDIHEQRFSQLRRELPPRIDTTLAMFGYQKHYGYDGIVFGHDSNELALVKHMSLQGVDWRIEHLQKTSHQNLVNLTDIHIVQEVVYFTYERPGIPLSGLLQYSRVVFDRIMVATICKEILHGLVYIRDVLKIGHGELNCDNVYINQNGRVQIGDIGKSMLREAKKDVLSHDIQAICNIAFDLLDLKKCSDTLSMSFLVADDFTKLPIDSRPEDLLKHPFLRISQGSWYLANLEFTYTVGLHIKSQCDHPKSSEGVIQSEDQYAS